MVPRFKWRLQYLALPCFLLVACDSGTSSEGNDVAVVVVTPSSGSAVPRETFQFAAEARRSDGSVLPGPRVWWESSDPSVAVVDEGGLATALRDGSANIQARVAGTQGSALLEVASNPDREAPELVAAGLFPGSVDISSGPRSVTIWARFRDEGSGVSSASAQLAAPQSAGITGFAPLALVKGDEGEGTWEGLVIIPESGPSGVWTLLFLNAVDRRGNPATWTTREMEEMGLGVELQVFGG